MKGLASPVTPFAVVREITSKTRFEWHTGGNLTPMVGRAREAAALYGHWEAAKIRGRADRHVVGAGGHREIPFCPADWWTGFRQKRKLVLKYQCSPHHTSTPLFPVIMGLNQTLEQMSAADRLGSLAKLFVRGIPESRKAPRVDRVFVVHRWGWRAGKPGHEPPSTDGRGRCLPWWNMR